MSVELSDIATTQHCLSVRFVGVAHPPVQCSNTGLKMSNKKCWVVAVSENSTDMLYSEDIWDPEGRSAIGGHDGRRSSVRFHAPQKGLLTRKLRGLPYMTSAVGGGRGSPKSRQKGQNQLICDSGKGQG